MPQEEKVYACPVGEDRVGGKWESYGVHIHEWIPNQNEGWRALPDGTRESVSWHYGLAMWIRTDETT